MSDDASSPVRASDDHTADAHLPSGVTSAPRRETHREPTPHSRRFVAAASTMIGVAVGALAIALAIAVNGGRTTSAGPGRWSTWKPADSGLAGAQEIADFVAPYYRATPASQLAVITAVNLNNGSNPLQIAIPSGSTTGGLVPLPSSSTIVYNLCGVGSKDCSIVAGRPSSNRLLLLRREGLELALYTFKYIGAIQQVVAILPPGHTVQGCIGICAKPHQKLTPKLLDIALAFDRSELAPWLSHPLRATLPEAIPPTVSQMPRAPEAELVSIITAHGLFSEHVAQAQDGSTVMALSPMAPQ